jgi:SAM-dependent methyltransferase
MENNWRIWNKDDKVELRTYQRAVGELPEMESAKQLVEMIKPLYKPETSILDFGCAAGHYYNSVRRLNPNVNYMGADATKTYIAFANTYFKGTSAKFIEADLFNEHADFGSFDIVYCCNVILHLPDFKTPFRTLINRSKKHVLVRTLISDSTLLSRYLYTDEFDDEGNPLNYVHQNTYSRSLLESYVKSLGDFKVSFIKDQFDAEQINKEHKDFDTKIKGVTRVKDNMQIVGSLVFNWEWMLIEK